MKAIACEFPIQTRLLRHLEAITCWDGAVRPMWHTGATAGSGVHETKIESKAI